jgi:Leucine-rich repeat (LRR) protein
VKVEEGVLPLRKAFGFDDELDESMAAEGAPSSSSSSLERNSAVPPLQLVGVSNNDEHRHQGHEENNDDNEEEDELSQVYDDKPEYVATQEGPVEESQEEGGELDEWRRQDDPEQPFELDPSLLAGWLELVRNNQHHLGAQVEFAQNLEFDSGNKFPRGVDRSAFGGDGAEDMVDEDHPLLLAHLVWRENYSNTTENFQSTAEGGGGDYAADADTAALTAAAAAGGRGDLLLDPSSSLAVDLSVENLTDLTMLKDATSLRKLDVSVNKLCSFDDVAHLGSLVEIAARDNVLESVQALAQLPGLKVLGLDTNHLTDLDALQDLPQLATLAARMNRLSIFPQLPASLERLELYHNQLTHVPSERLACLHRLTYLDLGRNKLTVMDGAALSQCQSLTHLVLSQNILTQVPCPLHLPVLRSLWLSGNQLQSLSAWEPTDMDDCPVFLPLLEKLYLQDNNIDAVPVKVGQLLPSLVALDISFNAIASSDGLLGLRECRALKSANVQDNPVTANADPAPWLRVLCPTLEEVSGRGGAAGVMAGGHALGFNSFGRWRQAVTFDASTDPPLQGTQLGVALQRSLTTTTPDDGGATGEPAPVATSALENFLNSSLDVDLTADGVRVGDLVEMHRDRARLASAFMADPSTVETLRAVAPSAPLRRFMHFLSLLVLKQNVSRARTAGEGQAYLKSLEELRTEMAQWCSEDDDGMLLPCTPVFVDLAVEEPTDAQTSGVGVVKAGGLVAVTKLQAVFRGVLARVKVRNAFGDIRYQDDELDAMFNDNDDLDDMLGDMGVAPSSKKPPSGADGDGEDGDGEGDDGGDSSRPSTTGGPAELKDGWLASTASGQLFSSSVVYGDHRRRKSSAPDSRQGMDAGEVSGIPGIEMTPADGDFFPGSEPDPGPEPEPEQEPASGSPPGPPPQPRAPLGVIRTGSNLSLSDGLTVRPLMPAPAPLVTPAPPPSLGLRGDEGGASDVRPSHGGRILSQALPPLTGRSTDMDMDDALDDDLDARLPRPLSAMSEISGLSMDSRARSEQGGRSMPADLSPRSQYTDSSLGGHSGGSKAVQQERAVAEEWGINDPTVLAAMMKRNRRLKSFQKQAADRDSNKSAQVRYDKFLKATTGGGGGGNALSGAAGGAKRSGRSAMQSKGSFGGAPKTFRPTGKAKKSKSVPAWKLGTDAHDDAA